MFAGNAGPKDLEHKRVALAVEHKRAVLMVALLFVELMTLQALRVADLVRVELTAALLFVVWNEEPMTTADELFAVSLEVELAVAVCLQL